MVMAGKTYFFTKSGNKVRAIARVEPYRSTDQWRASWQANDCFSPCVRNFTRLIKETCDEIEI